MNEPTGPVAYRGRIAPSPTGFLHLGHASTFWIAYQRALARQGVLLLRNEDLDKARCKPGFVSAMFEDLRWFGISWQEGPDVGGSAGPYNQSERNSFYREALEKLRAANAVYPCSCSRRDVLRAATAPHPEDDEPIYPGTCRHRSAQDLEGVPPERMNWRFRVPQGKEIVFTDGQFGLQQSVAGTDFGDFLVWRQDGIPAYQLAVVVDDAAMRITEVVRGADLLKSTARQLLLYQALKLSSPAFFHCALVLDENGKRMAKRHDALSLRHLRGQGVEPGELRGTLRLV